MQKQESLDLEIGGIKFELYHGRGETDDATWVFIPEAKGFFSFLFFSFLFFSFLFFSFLFFSFLFFKTF